MGAWLLVAGTIWQARLADQQFRREAALLDVRRQILDEVPWWRRHARRRRWREVTDLLTDDERRALQRMRHDRNAWALVLGGAVWVTLGTTIDQLLALF